MDLLNPIYTEKTECQDCYKCLRECTVKAIKVVNGHAQVVPELCILCAGRVAKGQKPACVQTCMSACMKHGRVEDLAKEINKPRMALFVPK